MIRGSGKTRHVDPEAETKDVTAYCAAETYNVHVARGLLRQRGWRDDVWDTRMFPQVLHVRIPITGESLLGSKGQAEDEASVAEQGDVFVFPSGSVVTWNLPDRLGRHLVEKVLLPAAENSHISTLEAEDLEYIEIPTRTTSQIIGDTILLGTKLNPDHDYEELPYPETDTTLTQIAFSSALARSTKLAVLESRLEAHIQTTIDIPLKLSQGKKPSTTRRFIMRKTGELLTLRAHLNLYGELTDTLPDIFWDSPHELGLETIYEAVGRELDIGARIKVLNGRLDYASEIAAVLREQLGEKHSHLLEWIIIWLIVVEVVYGSLHLWREHKEKVEPESDRNLLRAWLERELDTDW